MYFIFLLSFRKPRTTSSVYPMNESGRALWVKVGGCFCLFSSFFLSLLKSIIKPFGLSLILAFPRAFAFAFAFALLYCIALHCIALHCTF